VRNEEIRNNHIINPTAPSAARVVYDYYGGKEVFKNIPDEMMVAVDKADSAKFNLEDVLSPKGWELLSFLMDARTGLGRFREFRVSNYQLMMDLIAYCKNHSIEEILELPDVKERVELFFKYEKDFKTQLERCTKIYGNVAVVDLRKEEIIYPGNRFMVYAMYPEINISIHVIWGVKQQNTVFAVGKSIFDKSSKINIGDIMLKRGGGGHMAAGTCQIANEIANEELIKLIDELID
jgi:nanoRNase/pAp phosphatase (c-di-AMP/oligoRNAs hydrolase)